MKTLHCDNCLREIPIGYALHCEHCGKCFCPECARDMALCECAGELTYFD